jgi:hypothetical protein
MLVSAADDEIIASPSFGPGTSASEHPAVAVANSEARAVASLLGLVIGNPEC